MNSIFVRFLFGYRIEKKVFVFCENHSEVKEKCQVQRFLNPRR